MKNTIKEVTTNTVNLSFDSKQYSEEIKFFIPDTNGTKSLYDNLKQINNVASEQSKKTK